MSVKIFVIHASQLEIRKPRVEHLIGLLGKDYDVEYITEYDPKDIEINNIRSLFSVEKTNDEVYDTFLNNLSINQASNVLKHMSAIQKAAKHEGVSMILEDDLLYQEDGIAQTVRSVIKKFIKNEEAKFCMLGAPSRVSIDEDAPYELNKCSEHKYTILPCCDSYLLKADTAKQMANVAFPIKFAGNIQISWVLKQLNIEPHMFNKNVFLDGSKYGSFLSSMDFNSVLPFNMEFVKMYQAVAGPEPDETAAAALLKDMKFQNHPAMLHLQALYHVKCKNDYKTAMVLLDNAFEILRQNNCIINGTNPILKTYVSLLEHVQ
jgi:hypothetical protein